MICQSNNSMRRFADVLKKYKLAAEDSVQIVAHAKVPIIKFVDIKTGINVDMSFENATGLTANATFAGWKMQFPAMPVLVTVIKQFLMMRGLSSVQYGGLGGLSVTCLVVSMLQMMPRVRNGSLRPEHHLGEMLIEFLDLYGNRFDLDNTGIAFNPPSYYNKVWSCSLSPDNANPGA